MGKIDFTHEIRDHVIWNVRLRCFLDGGGECISEDKIVSPRGCSLGKWLHAEGREKFGMLGEIQELEKVHSEFHAIVKRVIQMKHAGNIDAAELELTKLESVNGSIIDLIMNLENKINTANRGLPKN